MNKGRQLRSFALGLLLGVLLIVIGVLGIHLFLSHMEAIEIGKVPKMTLEKGQRLFEEVGGTEVVNREAKILFARCEMKGQDFHILYPEDLKETPAMALLFSKCERYSGREYSGTSIGFYREEGRHHFLIKFGNHFMHRHIYIFDTDSKRLNPSESWIQLAANIFIEN